VLHLAPDAGSQRAARGLATTRPWRETGHTVDLASLWGLCAGSGAEPYQTCVDLTEPAFRCSCPSRKVPCKHALALMLLWSAGAIEGADQPPEWASEWLTERHERKAKAAARAEARAAGRPDADGKDPEDPESKDAQNKDAQSKTAERRAVRVEGGLAELDRWLTDQVRQGIAGATRAGYEHWDTMAARLVDAQAPALASSVRRLASVATAPDRLLTELSLIRLLVTAHRRAGELPPGLAATVRTRIGFPVATEQVLNGPRLRDRWAVIGLREEGDERLLVRRCWLHGATTDRPALVLTFAAGGQPLPPDLIPGTTVDADLCFYPGALPLRALVATRHAAAAAFDRPPGALTVAQALDRYAEALRDEPWLERWPMILADAVTVTDAGGRWHLRDAAGDALPVDRGGGPPWRLVAAAGGSPATVSAEWTTGGLRLLSAWLDGRLITL
jgi:hypothetical protein